MLSTDRPLFSTRCSLLSRGHNWIDKQILVIQNAILFYDKVQSFYDPEIFKIATNDMYAFFMPSEPEADESKSSIIKKFTIRIVQASYKRARLLSFNTKEEADAFQIAITASNSYAFYETYCGNARLEPHSYILKYTLEVVQQPDSPFYFKESFLAEDFYLPIYEYLKYNKLIENIVFQDLTLDPMKTNIILQLVTNFPKTQIRRLVFTNNSLTDTLFEHLLYGFGHQAYLEHLEISSNLLTDNALVYLSAILEYMPSLSHLNISGNQITGFQDLDTFLEAVLRDLELKTLDLSSNKLKDSTIDLFISYVFKQPDLSIKEFNLSRNNFSSLGNHKIIDSYYRCPNKENMKLILKPLPFHSSVLQRLVTENNSIDITVERISLNNLIKRPPTKAVELKNISELLVKISEIKGSSTTVEEISRICNKIYHLEYEFPPQKLELLHYVLRKKIQQALEESNYYATDVLLQAAEQVGLGIQEFEDEVKYIKIKVNKLGLDLIEILNFDIVDSNINEILDARLEEALSLGMRGHLIDTLLSLKERRDETIKNYDKEGYEDDVDDDDENPFTVLCKDADYAKIKGSIEVDLIRLDKALLLHPMQVNYYQLSKMEIPKINDTLQTASQKLAEDENYYMRNAYNRCYFILLASIENTRTVARRDKKLYNCRLIIQYRNYVHKKIEKPIPNPEIVFPIDHVVLPDNIQDISDQYQMENFAYLHSAEDLTKIFKKRLLDQSHTASEKAEKEKKEGSLSLTKLVGLKDFGSKKDTSAKSTPHNSFAYRVPNNILEFTMVPTSYSLLNLTNLDAETYALMINSLVLTIFSIDRSEPEFQTAIQTLIKAVQEQDVTKYYELNDEMYIQFYKITNRETIPLTKFYQQNVFAALGVISNFIQPEPELMPYVRSWLYRLMYHPELAQYIRRIIINLDNNEHPDFKKIYWTPSRHEIRDLLKYENKIVVEIRFQTGAPAVKQFTIPYNFTVRQLMDQVYSSTQISQLSDKYSFWLFRSSESTKFSGDVALFGETIVAQAISTWSDGPHVNTLFAKRRVFSSAFTLNLRSLGKSYIDSLYDDVYNKYMNSLLFGSYLKIESVVKTTALLFIIRQKKKGHDKIDISRAKIAKKINTMIPSPYLLKKNEDEWVERITSSLNYNVKWHEMDSYGLYVEFLSTFTNSPLFAASHFMYNKKDNIGDRNIPIEGIFCVNVFGIFFFSPTNRDKPSFCVRFEELSYMIGYGTICKICYLDKKFGVEVQTTLETTRARELTEDVISYASIRNLERTYVFYSFAIIRDFEKVYISRRTTTRADIDALIGEELSQKLEEAVETNEVVRIPDPSLAFHERLPFFDYTRVQPRRPLRKIQRQAPLVEDPVFVKTEPDAPDASGGSNSRRQYFSEVRRNNLDPAQIPVIKEEKKNNNIFTSIFRGHSEDSERDRGGTNPVKWAADTFMGIFRTKDKAHTNMHTSVRSDNRQRSIPPIDTGKRKGMSQSNANKTHSYDITSLDLSQLDDKSSSSYPYGQSLFEKRGSSEDHASRRKLTEPDTPISNDTARAEDDNEEIKIESIRQEHPKRGQVFEDKKGDKSRRSEIAVVGEATEDAEESKPPSPQNAKRRSDAKGLEAMKKIVRKQIIMNALRKPSSTIPKKEVKIESSHSEASEEEETNSNLRKLIKNRRRARALHLKESPFKGLFPKVRNLSNSFDRQNESMTMEKKDSDATEVRKKVEMAKRKKKMSGDSSSSSRSNTPRSMNDSRSDGVKKGVSFKETITENPVEEKKATIRDESDEDVVDVYTKASRKATQVSSSSNAIKSRLARKKTSSDSAAEDDEEDDKEERRRAKARQAINTQNIGMREEVKSAVSERTTPAPTMISSTGHNAIVKRIIKKDSDEEDEESEDDKEERRRAKTRMFNPSQVGSFRVLPADHPQIQEKASDVGTERREPKKALELRPPSLQDVFDTKEKGPTSPVDFTFTMLKGDESKVGSKSAFEPKKHKKSISIESTSSVQSGSESDDREKRRMNKKPAFNPYQLSAASRPLESIKDNKEPPKPTESPMKKDVSIANRIVKKKQSSDEDSEEEEEDKDDKRAKKLPALNPSKIQTQAQPPEKSQPQLQPKEDPSDNRKTSITNRSQLEQAKANRTAERDTRTEEEEESPSPFESALRKALSGALKAMPKATKVEKKNLNEDELFYKTDTYSEPQTKKTEVSRESVKEEPKEVSPPRKTSVKRPSDAKQPQGITKPQATVPEVKAEDNKTETKAKLGKALFGALKSMPKTKKVEKNASEDDRFFDH